MSTHIIGAGNSIRQLNTGDVVGELIETRNIDLHESPGKIRLAPATSRIATSAQLVTDAVAGLTYYDTDAAYIAVVDDDLFNGDFTLGNAPSATTNSVSSGQDVVVFLDNLLIAESTDITRYDGDAVSTYEWMGSWWNTLTGHTTLVTGVPHIMDVSAGGNVVYVTNNNKAESYTGSLTAGTFKTMTVSEDQILCAIKDGDTSVWVGSFTEEKDTAYLYEWDGVATDATRAHPVGARACLAIAMVGTTPYIVTEKGEIKRFNGAGFDVVARLPFALGRIQANNVETGLVQKTNVSRPVHPKGLQYKNGLLYLFCNFEPSTGDIRHIENTHAGVWVIDPNTGSCSHMSAVSGVSMLAQSSPLLLVNEATTRFVVGGVQNTAEADGLWIENYIGTNYGVATTTEIFANSVSDVWDTVYLDGNLNSGTVHMKYRTQKKYATPPTANITWTGTNTFTTTADLSLVAIGEEVDILDGKSAGRLTHITNISLATGTYTVTVGDAIGVNASTSKIRIDNWSYSGAWSSGNSAKLGIGEPSHKVQVRFYMIGVGVTIDRVLIHSNTKVNV